MPDKIEQITWGTGFSNISVHGREFPENGIPWTKYLVTFGDTKFPMKFNNIRLNFNEMTVFTFTGNIFVGKGKVMKFDIIRVPNGVVNGEITITEDKNG
jgi:hypothetical protein